MKKTIIIVINLLCAQVFSEQYAILSSSSRKAIDKMNPNIIGLYIYPSNKHFIAFVKLNEFNQYNVASNELSVIPVDEIINNHAKPKSIHIDELRLSLNIKRSYEVDIYKNGISTTISNSLAIIESSSLEKLLPLIKIVKPLSSDSKFDL